MDIFNFDDFRKFTILRLRQAPRNGHGQLKRLAEHLGVHTTFISQVFKGDKALSAEQGIGVAEYLGLSEVETRYFIKLIQLDRASTAALKRLIAKEAQSLKEEALRISNRFAAKKAIPDEAKAVFYSAWYYSAIRLLAGIDGQKDAETIAASLQLSRKTVIDVMNFLLEHGLLVRDKDGLKVGPSRTHLEPESPLIKLHHLNWRNRAIFSLENESQQKLHYSSPMTLGKKEAAEVRDRLVALIADVGKIIDPAPNEELMCLNIDWFSVR